MTRMRRPWTRLAGAAMAGHVFFELGAGVGMPFASVLGPAPAAALWTTATAWLQRAAGDPSRDTALAAVNGMEVAAAIGHLAGWPRRRTRVGLPWLVDCEGLGPELMRWYNPIVYTGGAAALVALLTENRSASRAAGLLPLALVPLLIRVQHAEHERLRRLAVRRPGWWNRRLQPERSWLPA
ncbi:MAG TPA: hypothetical protein VIH01_02340 [Blastococcus sp.]|jgi:hypothetical protein